MKITEHSLKRLALLTLDLHSQKEVLFIQRFILPGAKIIAWNHGIQIGDISLFARRCHDFGGRMIGLETWFDSPHGLYTFTYEDYSNAFYIEWYQQTIVELKREEVFDMIIPSVSFPEEVLKQYLE